MSSRAPRWGLVLAGILVLAAVLRLWKLGERSLWLDEVFTLRHVDGDLGHVLDRCAKEDVAPLYPLLAWAWSKAFGLSEAGLRSLPALLGVLTVPVVWAIGARLGGPRAAAFAALLAATSPFLVWHAQDARPYALLILLSAVALLGFVRALEEGARRRWLVVWALASAGAVATHYDAVFPFAAEAAWLLVALRARGVAPVLAACVPAVVTGLALLPLALDQSGGELGGGGLGGNAGEGTANDGGGGFLGIADPAALARRILYVPGQFLAGYQPPLQLAAVLVAGLLVLAAVVVGLRSIPRERLERLAPVAAVGAVVVVVPILLTVTGFDQVYTRFQSPAFVPLVVVLAAGLAWAARRAALAIAGGLVLFGVLVVVASAEDPKFGHQDWRGALDAAGPAGAVVLSATRAYEVVPVMRPDWEYWQEGTRVSEIASLALPPQHREIGREPEPPRPPTPAPPAGFRVVERRDGATFTLVRYRAAEPAVVGEAELRRLALGPMGTIVWEARR